MFFFSTVGLLYLKKCLNGTTKIIVLLQLATIQFLIKFNKFDIRFSKGCIEMKFQVLSVYSKENEE
jgi:hypothetical protein